MPNITTNHAITYTNLAYDWNYFSFSFIRWRFVFQTKISGNFTESIFFVFLFWLFLHRFVAVSISLLFIYFLHTACWPRKPSVRPLKGAVGGWGRGLGLFISNLFGGARGEGLNRPLPSSKNPHFQNKARCTTFLVKISFICMRMKNDFHIKPSLWNRGPGKLGNGLLRRGLV